MNVARNSKWHVCAGRGNCSLNDPTLVLLRSYENVVWPPLYGSARATWGGGLLFPQTFSRRGRTKSFCRWRRRVLYVRQLVSPLLESVYVCPSPSAMRLEHTSRCSDWLSHFPIAFWSDSLITALRYRTGTEAPPTRTQVSTRMVVFPRCKNTKSRAELTWLTASVSACGWTDSEGEIFLNNHALIWSHHTLTHTFGNIHHWTKGNQGIKAHDGTSRILLLPVYASTRKTASK